MPVITATDIPDLIEATLEDLGPFKMTDLSFDTQEFHAYNRLLRQSQVDKQGGSRCRINILTDYNQTSRWTGLYSVDGQVGQTSGMTHGQVDWRFNDFNWGWDEREADINSGESQIQDYVRTKRHQAYMGNAVFVEDWFWGAPPVQNDTLIAYPLRYWLTKDVTTTGTGSDTSAGGGSFSGSYPTGSDGNAHTTIAGLTLTGNLARFKNWTFKYVDITETDLFTKWMSATRRTMFTPPTGLNQASQSTGDRYQHFVSERTLSGCETLGKLRNENLGYDFAAIQPTFARAPITWAPKLDADTDDPIYSINWGTIKTAILKNKWMVERKAERAPSQHHVWVNWIDSQWQILCYDRRRNIVGARAAANP